MMELSEAISIVARSTINNLVVDAVYGFWEVYDEIGEFDWVECVEEARRLVTEMTPTLEERDNALAFLKERCEKDEDDE